MGTGFGVSRGAVATHPKRACRARPPDWGWVVPAHWNPSLEPLTGTQGGDGAALAGGGSACAGRGGCRDPGWGRGRMVRAGAGGGHSRGTEAFAVAEAGSVRRESLPVAAGASGRHVTRPARPREARHRRTYRGACRRVGARVSTATGTMPGRRPRRGPLRSGRHDTRPGPLHEQATGIPGLHRAPNPRHPIAATSSRTAPGTAHSPTGSSSVSLTSSMTM